MPVVKVFIDSTSFLYSRDRGERQKAEVIADWLDALVELQAGVTNLQVLNEMVSVMTRKRKRFADLDPFFEADLASDFGSNPLTREAAFAARIVHLRYNFSWWDCLLLASALELGCTHFLSEDLQDGQTVALSPDQSLTIFSPFAHSPDDILIQH